MHRVRRGHVARLQPGDVARHVISGDELLGPHAQRHRRQALLGHLRRVLVNGRQPRRHHLWRAQFAVGTGDARREILDVRRWGRREQQLPAARHAVAGILCQDAVQHGGPGSRRPGDEPRLDDLLVHHAGVTAHVVVQGQSLFDQSPEEPVGDPPAEHGEPGLGLQSVGEDAQRFEGLVAQPVTDVRRTLPPGGSGARGHLLDGEGRRGSIGHRPDRTAVDRRHPVRSWPWRPGHVRNRQARWRRRDAISATRSSGVTASLRTLSSGTTVVA